MKTQRPLLTLRAFLSHRILLCLVPLVLLSSWLALDSVLSLRGQQTREAEHLAQNLVADVEMFLDNRIRALQMLADSSLLDDSSLWPHLHSQAQGFFRGFGSHVILFETGPSVDVRLHSRVPFGDPMPRPPPAATAAAEAAATSGKPTISNVFVGALTEEPMVIIAVPAVRNGQTTFVFVAPIATRQFHHYLERYSLPSNWIMHLHDRSGEIIAGTPPENWSYDSAQTGPGHFHVSSELSGWTVFLCISPQIWQGPLIATASHLAAGILLTTIIGLLIGRHTSRRLHRAVSSLIQPDKPAEDMKIDEFFTARRLLDNTREQMQQNEERFRKLFDQTPVGLVLADQTGRVLAANNHFTRLFGYSIAEMPTINEWWSLAYPDPDYRTRVMTQWEMATRQDEQKDGYLEPREFHVNCHNGSRCVVQISAIRVEQNTLTCFIDVTEQRQLELRLKQQQAAEIRHQKATQLALLNQMQDAIMAREEAEQAVAELKQRNAALEQFHYTVSHDLRTPLVTIETFLGFLEQDLDNADKEQTSRDVNHIRTATRRMNALLDDLGKLLQAKKTETVTLVDFDQLMEEVRLLIAGPAQAHGLELKVHPGTLSLLASRNHLIQIWQNLIENAIKYMGEQPQPVIEIGVDQQPQGPIFYVRDNGIGIEESDQQRIFGLFDQLDPNNPGSGLGLTLVKRIVEMYGGRIWVESQGEGHGSCFYFTLPSAAATNKLESR